MKRAPLLAGLALVGTLVLTGCSSVPALNGGLAASVGDEAVTLQEVADTSAAYCSAVETQLTEGQSVANSVVSAQVAGALALRAAAEQFAAEEGVAPDASFEEARDGLELSIAELTAEQQEAVRRVNLARPYVAAVELAVGKRDVGGSDAEAAAAAGHEAFAAWVEENDVRIDPRFTITIEDGTVARADTAISFPVSKAARTGASGEPDETYAAGLPSTQRCG